MAGPDEPLFDNQGKTGSAPAGDSPELEARIRRLVERQPYAVLCTQSHTQPYGSLVAFAFSDDLKQAVFVTPIATRKYRFLSECRQIALVIDDRPTQKNFMSVEAITATGRASQLEREEAVRWGDLLVARHHYLESFVTAPSCALFRIDIVRFFHVVRFQEVHQWTP